MGGYLDEYVTQLEREIELAACAVGSEFNVHTIYFGGGTPTMMNPHHFQRILNSVVNHYKMDENPEISTEANPYRLNVEYLRNLRDCGINRLSMGMQSAIPSELNVLGRTHSPEDVLRSVEFARQSGFENISLDLIFGIPSQTLSSFQSSIEFALELNPKHLSVYALTVEAGTLLEKMISRGEIFQPDEDLAAEMYAWVMDFLKERGFDQYEISNWASSEKFQCLHNLQYWRNRYYLGFGAGAHSHYNHRRWANASSIPDYIQKMQACSHWMEDHPPAAVEVIPLTQSDCIQETMMMGLRLVEEGIVEDDFQIRFDLSVREIYQREINDLMESNLLEEAIYRDKKTLRLTCKGRMLGNQVFMQFIKV